LETDVLLSPLSLITGNCVLARVNLGGNIQLPIYVKTQVFFAQNSGKFDLSLQAKNTGGKPLENLALTMPLPSNVSTVNATANYGNYQYDPNQKRIKWTLGRMPAQQKIPMLSGTASFQPGFAYLPFPDRRPSLTHVLDVNSTQVDGNATVMAEFKINLFNISGLKVEALNITGEPYKPYKARIPTAYFAWSPGSHCFLRFPLYRVLRVSPSLGNSRSERRLKGETGGEPKCPFLVSFLTLMF